MSQISQVQINYNFPSRRIAINILPKAFIIGISQRGPVYKQVRITNIADFLIVFGQPTNPFEFNFFQSVKSVVNAGGIAVCYRIPYSDYDKQLYRTKFEYYITDVSKIEPPIIENFVFRDYYNRSPYYKMFVGPKDDTTMGLYIQETYQTENYVDYVVLKANNSTTGNIDYYKLFITDHKLYAEFIANLTPEDEQSAMEYLTFEYNSDGQVINYIIELQYKDNDNTEIGVYLSEAENRDSTTLTEIESEFDNTPLTFDAIYKQYNDHERNFNNLPGVKLSFTLINDFDSVLELKENDIGGTPQLALRRDCLTLKEDIDPEQIIGIFPIIFGPKDADNLRQLNLGQLCYYNKESKNYIDVFDTYLYRGTQRNVYAIYMDQIQNELLGEFEHANHYQRDWLEKEIGKLIDKHIPQDITECKNTIGVAFFALYLDDEHKVDYRVLESYFGLIGSSNNKFYNIEDYINENSRFFNLKIDGEFETEVFTEGLNIHGLIYNDWYVPLSAPYTKINEVTNIIVKDLELYDIFETNPINKFDKDFSQSLSQIYNRYIKSEFQNSVPFDYVIAPGLADIFLIKSINPGRPATNNCIVKYTNYKVSLNKQEPIENLDIIKNQTDNLKSLFRLIAFYTGFGDKGTIGMIDVPKIYSEYLRSKISKYESNEQVIKKELDDLLTSEQYGIFPSFIGTREIYDRLYPLFNYQYVDKDASLTRYHKHKFNRRLELIPCSAAVIGPYILSTYTDNFDPIAGIRSAPLFTDCHHTYMECNPRMLKILYELFGVSSLINDKDNNTFPIQQTTWRNTKSVLKQLHAFRIYVAIRRRAYRIAKAYLYEPNTETNRNNLLQALKSMLNFFKERHYIDSFSSVDVWADLHDIENNQVQIQMTVGIFGAIVKIVINLNLQNTTIEII